MAVRKKVVIAGGGLAGLSCAMALSRRGLDVQVFEGRAFLGGRAATWRDPDGDWVEEGLHLFLGQYSQFKQLLRDVGQDPDDVLFWTKRVHFADPRGPRGTFGIHPVLAPLQTLRSVLGENRYLGVADKLSLVRLFSPAILPHAELMRRYDGMSVTEYWRSAGGRRDVMDRFLRPFCRAIQFSDPDEFSAYALLGFVHNLLRDLPHNLAGGYRGPRADTIFLPIARELERSGVRIHRSARLRHLRLEHEGTRVRALAFSDRSGGTTEVTADLFILAIPFWELSRAMPKSLRETTFFSQALSLPVAPAISVQLWFEHPVIGDDEFHLVARSPVPVYQDLAPRTFVRPGESHVSMIVSPADGLLDENDDAVVELALRELRRANRLPRNVRPTKVRVLKHRSHLLRPLPGALSKRPGQRTPLANLLLAGDWTQQDFFGSQEGAVRSGIRCAEELLLNLERSEPRIVRRAAA